MSFNVTYENMVRQYNTDNATRCVQAHPMSVGQISPCSSRFRIPVQNPHFAHVKYIIFITNILYFFSVAIFVGFSSQIHVAKMQVKSSPPSPAVKKPDFHANEIKLIPVVK